MAALAVVEYQMVVSRVVDAQETGVLTVGSIQAGSAGQVLVTANLRWFHENVREQMITGIKISTSIATAY